MWNFWEGVEKPKRKQTPEEKQKDKTYEAKCRKQSFQEEWKQGRPWLRFDSEAETIFCDYCIKAGVEPEKSTFVKGCTNIKFEAVKYHQGSNSHLFATRKYLHEKNPGSTPAMKAHLSLNKSVSDKLMILFCTVHALNIKARPLADYLWMTEMDLKKGLDIPGERYKTVHACRDFSDAIASVEMQTIKRRFEKSKFVAVIVDGTVDSSRTENEIVFIQTCIGGEIHTDFLKCCQVQRGNADGILNAIKRATSSISDWKEFGKKLVALGSDGASVMLGSNNGVIALLQKEKPNIIGIHCCGHRLELAYKDAFKRHPLAEKITTLLIGLYYFYKTSALNRTNLKHAFKCLGMKTLLPLWASGTRWVGHIYVALDHFIKGYKAIRLHLEQLIASKEKSTSKSKAQGFLKLMKSSDIVAMALFLQDVLFILKKVSLKFQEENSVVADVFLTIRTTIRQLEALKFKDGPFSQNLDQFELSNNPSRGSTTCSLVQLCAMNGDIKKHKEQLLQDIGQALSTRFENNASAVTKATSVANFKEWPLDGNQLQGINGI